MDFLPKTANLQGGDTRKTPNLANHGVLQEGKTPPYVNPFNPSQSRHITAYHGVPSQSFLIQIPIGLSY